MKTNKQNPNQRKKLLSLIKQGKINKEKKRIKSKDFDNHVQFLKDSSIAFTHNYKSKEIQRVKHSKVPFIEKDSVRKAKTIFIPKESKVKTYKPFSKI